VATRIRGPEPIGPRRIVLGYDLSASARDAAALVASVDWHPGTEVRVVTSPVGIGYSPPSFAGPIELRDIGLEIEHAIVAAQQQLADELFRGALNAHAVVADGPPARAIVEQAREFGADLVVVGARDQGPLSATIWGSVSSAVIDEARCPVLVSRGLPVTRVLMVLDRSSEAATAADLTERWPLFAEAQVRVLQIDDPRSRLSRFDRWRSVEWSAERGDIPARIVRACRELRPDVVVLGLSGHNSAHRAVRGTVARRILHRVAASVLVARPTPGH
jgi:nucleotide-binding universal stress UspA family protein